MRQEVTLIAPAGYRLTAAPPLVRRPRRYQRHRLLPKEVLGMEIAHECGRAGECEAPRSRFSRAVWSGERTIYEVLWRGLFRVLPEGNITQGKGRIREARHTDYQSNFGSRFLMR
jgi:hypothetical protein